MNAEDKRLAKRREHFGKVLAISTTALDEGVERRLLADFEVTLRAFARCPGMECGGNFMNYRHTLKNLLDLQGMGHLFTGHLLKHPSKRQEQDDRWEALCAFEPRLKAGSGSHPPSLMSRL